MANYESRMRTSYFNVKDEDAFLNEINELELDADIEKTDHGFILLGSDFTYGSQEQLDENGDYIGEKEVSVFTIIQNHLKEGEIVLVNSIGYEKMKYLHGTSFIITPKVVLSVCAEEAVKEKAVELGLLTKDQADNLECIL
ncbi:hypothetical protein CHH61_03890 [Shouchella clausii]|jgi:hypothetical protein|uniref:Uncharacterized protein n=1 Tax=Shouchella clausii TaxID=79880 RepID=A0A268S493_SHOCL|nr:hypothetical protein [Shouchella clausii]PAF27335.1 hypothetical protein CHH61_03890 [Shouchella clausii]